MLVVHPSPRPKIPTHPFTPEVLQARERIPTPYPFVIFTFGLIVESIKEFGGVSTQFSYDWLKCLVFNKPIKF
jgi:hypothetical protein